MATAVEGLARNPRLVVGVFVFTAYCCYLFCESGTHLLLHWALSLVVGDGREKLFFFYRTAILFLKYAPMRPSLSPRSFENMSWRENRSGFRLN